MDERGRAGAPEPEYSKVSRWPHSGASFKTDVPPKLCSPSGAETGASVCRAARILVNLEASIVDGRFCRFRPFHAPRRLRGVLSRVLTRTNHRFPFVSSPSYCQGWPPANERQPGIENAHPEIAPPGKLYPSLARTSNIRTVQRSPSAGLRGPSVANPSRLCDDPSSEMTRPLMGLIAVAAVVAALQTTIS